MEARYGKILIFLSASINLLLIPNFVKSPYLLRVIIFAHDYVILSTSWDIIAGYCGQVTFGHSMFFGIGAYSTAFLAKWVQISPWYCLLLGAGLAGLFSLVVGTACLRLRGPYLSIVTFSFSMVFTSLIYVFSKYTGGEEGIIGIPSISSSLVGNYFLSLFLMLISLGVLYLIANSHMGKIFITVREDELAAEMAGIDTTKSKILAFFIGSFFAGLVGSFRAVHLGFVTPDVTSLLLTTNIVMFAIVGGRGTIIGPAIGAYSLTIANELLRISEGLRILIMMIILVVFLLFAPGGIAKLLSTRARSLLPKVLNRGTTKPNEGRKK